MRAGKWVWLARDGWPCSDYLIFDRRPKAYRDSNGHVVYGAGPLGGSCHRDFERVTRFKLKPGERERVRFTVETWEGQ
jgi:hypothetical protein